MSLNVSSNVGCYKSYWFLSCAIRSVHNNQLQLSKYKFTVFCKWNNPQKNIWKHSRKLMSRMYCSSATHVESLSCTRLLFILILFKYVKTWRFPPKVQLKQQKETKGTKGVGFLRWSIESLQKRFSFWRYKHFTYLYLYFLLLLFLVN